MFHNFLVYEKKTVIYIIIVILLLLSLLLLLLCDVIVKKAARNASEYGLVSLIVEASVALWLELEHLSRD